MSSAVNDGDVIPKDQTREGFAASASASVPENVPSVSLTILLPGAGVATGFVLSACVARRRRLRACREAASREGFSYIL